MTTNDLLQTTLAKIKPIVTRSRWERIASSSLSGTQQYTVGNTPVIPLQILDSSGLDDALWVLRACDNSERFTRLLACDYAEHVLHIFGTKYPNNNRLREGIEVSRRFADGTATMEELRMADLDAWAVARTAATGSNNPWGPVAELEAAKASWATAAARAAVAAAYAVGGVVIMAAATAAKAAEADRASDGVEERCWQEQRLRELLEPNQ